MVLLAVTLALSGCSGASEGDQPPAWIWTDDRQRSLADGRGQRIAVLDTGLAPSFANTCRQCSIDSEEPPNTSRSSDQSGHGTSMMATIVGVPDLRYSGVAPAAEVTMFPLTGHNSAVATGEVFRRALDRALRGGYDIINVSMGSQTPDRALARSIRRATARGINVTAAAGPDPTSIVLYPAAYPGVMAASGDGAAYSPGDHRHGREASSEAEHSHNSDAATLRFPVVEVPLRSRTYPQFDSTRDAFSLISTNDSSYAAAMLAGLIAGQRSAAKSCRNVPQLPQYISMVVDNSLKARPLLYGILSDC